MQVIIVKFFKAVYLIRLKLSAAYSKLYCSILFYTENIKHESFSSLGVPFVHISINARCEIGKNFKMNNGVRFSNSGVNGRCRIEVRDNGRLKIGNDVGISDVTITCHETIVIKDNILIGVGTQIRDTDNHSLNPEDWIKGKDWLNKKTAPIEIGNNVFIGAYSTILKGVIIGDNSIIGAGSVVTRNIPSHQIWAGNPARFVKENDI